MSLYTNGAYLEYHPTWHSEDSPWKAAQIQKMLVRNRLKPQTIGEVGCGAGVILSTLAKTLDGQISFYGYEISKDAYRLSLDQQTQHIHFHLADLLEIDAPLFDVLLAIDVIEHIEDVFSFLRRLRCKGNYKIFHIPLDFHLIHIIRPNILANMRRQIGHLHYFTKDTALALLTDTGYSVIDWFYTPGALELASTTRKFARLNPMRRMIYSIKPDLAVRLFGGYSLLVLAQ